MTYKFHIHVLSKAYEEKGTQAKAKKTPKKWIFEHVIYRSTMLLILPFNLSMLSFLHTKTNFILISEEQKTYI